MQSIHCDLRVFALLGARGEFGIVPRCLSLASRAHLGQSLQPWRALALLSEADVQPDIAPADKRLRMLTLIVAIVLLAAGYLAYTLLLPRYLEFLRHLSIANPARLKGEYERAFHWMFGVIALLTAAIGYHALRLGVKTRRAALFPPPDVKVIVDTKIVRGTKAQRLGALMIAGALGFSTVGLLGAWYMHKETLNMLAPLVEPLTAPLRPG